MIEQKAAQKIRKLGVLGSIHLRAETAFQAEISGLEFWPVFQAEISGLIFPGQNFRPKFFRPEFQAKIPGQNSKPKFQAEISGQNSKPKLQAKFQARICHSEIL